MSSRAVYKPRAFHLGVLDDVREHDGWTTGDLYVYARQRGVGTHSVFVALRRLVRYGKLVHLSKTASTAEAWAVVKRGEMTRHPGHPTEHGV